MSTRVHRRTLLAGFAAVPVIGLLGCDQDRTTAAPISTVGTLDFGNPLVIPPLTTGTVIGGVRTFALRAGPSATEFLPGRTTATWAYSDGRSPARYLGPTLRAQRGEQVRVIVRNDLADSTTVHWHGMHLPARYDGGPHQPIKPGATWSPQWSIEQPAATLWYHPHPHGQTEGQVNRGLAGLFYLEDGSDPDLPHRYGVDDVPLILQDRRFDAAGQFDLNGHAVTGYVGDTILVNGTYNPHLRVTTRRVRLRILNGSSARIYHLAFADNRAFALTGTDAGHLPAPRRIRDLLLSPAERAEIVVDVTAGDRAVLRSIPWNLNMAAPLTDGAGGNDHLDLLQLRADHRLNPSRALPASLTSAASPDTTNVAAERTFVLDGRQINGRPMDMTRIDTVVGAGTCELWTVHNAHNQPHNFHIHGVSFQILPPPASRPDPTLGWKDTVLLAAGETATLAIGFPSYTDARNPYMYHCHLLWHEDEGMMAQFTVVEPGQIATAPRVIPDPHQHG